jgi:hypothetical protein
LWRRRRAVVVVVVGFAFSWKWKSFLSSVNLFDLSGIFIFEGSEVGLCCVSGVSVPGKQEERI